MKRRPTSQTPEWDISKILKWTTDHFAANRIDGPRTDAEILLAHTLGCRRIDLYLNYDQPLSQDERSAFKSLVKRRLQREPVAYIVGTKEFWSLDLQVNPAVLIPRPDTECIVEAALAALPGGEDGTGQHVLELGTGSGAIVIALASERPQSRFYASDQSLDALAIAQQNAIQNKVSERIDFFCADWLLGTSPAASFDMIVSNPPYIATAEISQLLPEVAQYEPRAALDGDADGLAALRHIIGCADSWLRPGGWLLLEIGYDQRMRVEAMAGESGHYVDVHFRRDYGGNDRVVSMRRRG